MTSRLTAPPAALIALAVGIAPAMADEMWRSSMGLVYWESSVFDTAILRVDDDAGGVGMRIYVPGLAADMLSGRYRYEAVWISTFPDGIECDFALTAPDGLSSSIWGTLTMTFVHETAPSDWAGSFGYCFEPGYEPVSGVAVTGR